ncbi:MAG: glycine betaine/L-proline ABC transporter ATP-binding protein [Candidatus Methanomethylophilaceae archaeon]
MTSIINGRRPLKGLDDRVHDIIENGMEPIKQSLRGSFNKTMDKIRSSTEKKVLMESMFSNTECPLDEEGNRVVIRVNGLTKIFGKSPEKAFPLLEEGKSKDEILKMTNNTVGLYDVCFDVKEGEIFVLMGLSGSGKSTLERCLNRLIEPTRGSILLEGLEFTSLDEETLRIVRRGKMSMVFQNFGLLPHRDVKNNIAYGLEVQGMPEKERLEKAQTALEMVGLSGYEDSYPSGLSGGMKQRVGLARALATGPDILFMDEAFSALDPLIRKDMQEELLKLQAELAKTIVFVTHDLDEALKLGDRIALMKDGRIVQIGTAEDILQRPADEYVSRFVEEVDRTRILTAGVFMRKPRSVVYLSQGPRTALKLMEESDRNAILVVDKKRRLQGLLDADDALRAVKNQETMQSVINPDIPRVSLETPMSEVIQMMITTNFSIPVVDDEGLLLGVVSQSAAVEALNVGGDL